jgi:hypothetical protein
MFWKKLEQLGAVEATEPSATHLAVDVHLSSVHVVEQQLHDVYFGVLDGNQRVGTL